MYYIVTLCDSLKYEILLPHWKKRVSEICKNCSIVISRKDHYISELNINYNIYAWWDVVRLTKVIELLKKGNTVVHCDLDIIILKDINPLTKIDSDFIISCEINGNNAYPKNCSNKLGFGVCTAFYVAKPSALKYLENILSRMIDRKYENCYSDQVTIMNSIVNNEYTLKTEPITFNNMVYENRLLETEGIKMCVLDFEIIRRDPITDQNHFGMHISIDNVGGSNNFVKYFYQDFKTLPRTCRCNFERKHCTYVVTQ